MSAPADSLPRCIAWLGAGGWQDTPPPRDAIDVTVQATTEPHWQVEAAELGAPISAPAEHALSELEWRIITAALARSTAPLTLHAATLTSNAGMIALIGQHAAGKTTLALTLADAGWRVLGDDIAFVDADGRMTALARSLRVRDASLPYLPPAFAATVRDAGVHDEAEQLRRVPRAAVGAEGEPTPRSPDALVFVSYERDAITDLRAVDSASALPRLLEHSCSDAVDAAGARAALALLARARPFALTYGGHPSVAADALARAVVRD